LSFRPASYLVILLAGAIELALSLSLSEEAIHALGLRVPFLAGILNIPVALVMRMQGILAAIGSLSSVLLVVIPEILPASVRSAGLSVSYALGVTLFGSTAQPIVACLIHATGNPPSPAWFLILANVIGIATVLTIPETKDALLQPDGSGARRRKHANQERST
jgi:Sugar (and other) transporter